jgi:hypothetical protein
MTDNDSESSQLEQISRFDLIIDLLNLVHELNMSNLN